MVTALFPRLKPSFLRKKRDLFTAIEKNPLYKTPKPHASAISSILAAASAPFILSREIITIAAGAFLKNFSGAFYNMMLCWLEGGMKETPEAMADEFLRIANNMP